MAVVEASGKLCCSRWCLNHPFSAGPLMGNKVYPGQVVLDAYNIAAALVELVKHSEPHCLVGTSSHLDHVLGREIFPM